MQGLIYTVPIIPTLAALIWLLLRVRATEKTKGRASATSAFLQGTIVLAAMGTVLMCASALNRYYHGTHEERTRDTWFEPGSIFAPLGVPLAACFCFIVSSGPGGTLGLIVARIYRKSSNPLLKMPKDENVEKVHDP